VFRTEFTSNQIGERAFVLFSIAQQLKNLSDEYKLPIIIVNQVSDKFEEFSSFMSKSRSIPAMGLAWANCLNMRIFLEKTSRHIHYEVEVIDHEGEEPPNKKRKIETSGVPIRKNDDNFCSSPT